jgi:CRP/FNR family transcriptional regulator, cyclic AMP receptor protein
MYPNADLLQTIRHLPWFTGLTQFQLEQMASIASLQHLETGEILFKEGDRDDSLYVLLEGQVALEIEVPTRGRVAFFNAEMLDIIGWSSLTPVVRQRTAQARAKKASLLLGFNSKLLEQLCEEDHEIGYIVMRRLANVVANRLLTTRLCLLDMIVQTVHQGVG